MLSIRASRRYAVLLLGSSLLLSCDGSPAGVDLSPEQCRVTLSSASARPTQTVFVSGVPARFADSLLYATMEAAGTEIPLSLAREADGRFSLVVPAHPQAPFAGGAAQLTVGAGTEVCKSAAFQIGVLPQASGTTEAVTTEMQEVVASVSAALGVSPEQLRGDTALLPAMMRPLAAAQFLLDDPANPNSVRAILSGSAPVLEGSSLDPALLDALLKQADVLGPLRELSDSLAALGPAPAGMVGVLRPAPVAGRSPVRGAAPSPFHRGSTQIGATRPGWSISGSAQAHVLRAAEEAQSPGVDIRTAEQLAYWMKLQAQLARNQEKAETALSNLGLVLAGVGLAVPASAPLLVLLGLESYVMQLVADGLRQTLPSTLDPLQVDVSARLLPEDRTAAEEWSNARLTARGEEWRMQLGRMVDGVLVGAGSTMAKAYTGLMKSPALSPQTREIIAAAYEQLFGQLNQIIGGAATGEGLYVAGPYVYGPVDVTSDKYTDALVTPAGVIEISAVDIHRFRAVAPGTADLVVRTDAKFFGGPVSEYRQPIQVAQIAIEITPASPVEIRPSSKRTFAAAVSGAENASVIWSTTCGTLDAAGGLVELTAPAQETTCTLTARHEAKTNRTASVQVHVVDKVVVSISPVSASVAPGGQRQFTATVEGSTNTGVQWSASAGTITSGGLYTAPQDTGTYVVQAQSVADPSRIGTATVEVSDLTGEFTLVDLGVPFVQTNGLMPAPCAFGLNNNGTVAVSLPPPPGTYNGRSRAGVWRNGNITQLSSADSWAHAVNDDGVVAGGYMTYSATFNQDAAHAAVWSGATVHGLPGLSTPDGEATYWGSACGINSRGDVVGVSARAVLWRNGSVINLGTLVGPGWEQGAVSQAYAINDAGEIVGCSTHTDQGNLFDDCTIPVVWRNGGIQALPDWVGRADGQLGDHPGTALDINGNGHIVGALAYASDEYGQRRYRAAHWNGGNPAALPMLRSHVASTALAINDGGEVVGESCDEQGGCRAVTWRGGEIFDLNGMVEVPSGWVLEQASEINEYGWIVAVGRRWITEVDSETRVFLLER